MSDGGKYRLPMPPTGAGRYLVDHLLEVGPTTSTGMGAGALTWAELQAWQRQIGIELHPWELRMVRRLSRDFAVEAHRATAPDAAPPWREETPLARARVDSQLRSILGGLARKGKAS